MHYKDDYSNIDPNQRKLLPKFNIENELGADTRIYEREWYDAIFAIARLGDYMGIKLITHHVTLIHTCSIH